jgi:cyclic pyranopterin monophosphate synthase
MFSGEATESFRKLDGFAPFEGTGFGAIGYNLLCPKNGSGDEFSSLALPRDRLMNQTRKLSHYDSKGRIRMVDVSEKAGTDRRAVASVLVKMRPRTRGMLRLNPKGDALEIARIAGIAAAKRTAELIPLCHPLLLSHIDVRAELCKNGILITSTIRSMGKTGVEMEALTAAAVAALTVYDMCKALDRSIEITRLRLLEKSGGKTGIYRAPGMRA